MPGHLSHRRERRRRGARALERERIQDYKERVRKTDNVKPGPTPTRKANTPTVTVEYDAMGVPLDSPFRIPADEARYLPDKFNEPHVPTPPKFIKAPPRRDHWIRQLHAALAYVEREKRMPFFRHVVRQAYEDNTLAAALLKKLVPDLSLQDNTALQDVVALIRERYGMDKPKPIEAKEVKALPNARDRA